MTDEMKSASSGQKVSLKRKIDEALRLAVLLFKGRNPFRKRDFSFLLKDVDEYTTVYARFAGGRDLAQARILEIGCGQRPYRLFALLATGHDARAIDMDKVVLSMPGFREIFVMLRRNGLERTAKTILRYTLFDIWENRQFNAWLSAQAGRSFNCPLERIAHGDAADPKNWPDGEVDFIYSEDVFEHIPETALRQLCALMAQKMTPEGIALIRPMVFTGIMGGHNVEWYDVSPKARHCPPWDHLRGHAFPANTFLNRLTLRDYRAIFTEHFEVLEEQVMNPDLGQTYLTPELRAELQSWDEDELFSNHVRFVLRRK